ncbi:MAG: SDR family oxidoreductase [Cupriavidus sp.]|nr:MAG: SDR family oxidoreductase [Cupriavidus sp.]
MKGKVTVVTGVLGALGQAVAEAAVAAGATVVGLDRASNASLPGIEMAAAVDLGDAGAVRESFGNLASRYGHIDALVNVAGGFSWETLGGGSIETWDRLYMINLRTAVNACQAVLPYLPQAGGRIVNIGAAGAAQAGEGMGAYAASKSGVARLTEALAEELKPRDVTVNAVLPSVIDTPANRIAMPDADFSKWVSPQSLADVILFLLSERARAVTGALIPVSGRV